MTATFAGLKTRFAPDVEFLTEVADDLKIPVVTDLPQAQGDLMIAPRAGLLPRRVSIRQRNTGVPVTHTPGIEVIRGGAMNNAHTLRTLHAGVMWYSDLDDTENLALGIVVIPDDAVCYLEHREHGFNAIGPGAYVIGRQREQTDVIRMVAD